MIPKPIESITADDIHALVAAGFEEGPRLDFKRDLPKDDSEGKKAFYADICAFANSAGGDLVYGIQEADGVAKEVLPLTLPMGVDGYVLKLTSAMRDSIEPGLHGVQIKAIDLTDGKHALVIRVPRSGSGIHRSRRDGQFYVRRSRSNEQLDVPGIVSRVSDMLGREDRLASFFARRYADIASNQTSLNLRSGPKLVVHALPVRDFLSGEDVDVWGLNVQESPPFLQEGRGYSTRNTVEGRAFYDADDNAANHYTLLMSNGVVESCTDLVPHYWPEQYQHVNLGYVEQCVLRFARSLRASTYVERTCGLPMVVRVALLGANDLRFGSGHPRKLAGSTHGLPIRQPLPLLCLPDALVEAVDQPLDHLLHGTFLRMWLAWGYNRSYFYTQVDGLWTRKDD